MTGTSTSTHTEAARATSLIRLEAPGKPEIGGLAVFYPSGASKKIAWHSVVEILPTLEAAKKYATDLVDERLKAGAQDDVDRTNWASVVAAIDRILRDWNRALRDAVGLRMVDAFGEHITKH